MRPSISAVCKDGQIRYLLPSLELSVQVWPKKKKNVGGETNPPKKAQGKISAISGLRQYYEGLTHYYEALRRSTLRS